MYANDLFNPFILAAYNKAMLTQYTKINGSLIFALAALVVCLLYADRV